MIRPAFTLAVQPVLRRFAALAPLDRTAFDALEAACATAKSVPPRREVQIEGTPVGPARIIAAGWAARVRLFGDGRRQFLSFLLPGDVIALCDQPGPLAISTIVALTPVELAVAPSPAAAPALAAAYAASRALHEAYLLEQIVRLGRLNAAERIASLLLELHERLALIGMLDRNAFDLPLTQEMLGDALGLTSVHINRMLQQARRNGDLIWQGGRVTLIDPAALAKSIGRDPVRVSG